MDVVKSHEFWIGLVVGAVVVPWLMKKASPSAAAKMPGQ